MEGTCWREGNSLIEASERDTVDLERIDGRRNEAHPRNIVGFIDPIGSNRRKS